MGLLSYIMPSKGDKDKAPVRPEMPTPSPSGFATPHGELSEEAEKRRTLKFDMMCDYLRQQVSIFFV